MVSTALPGSLLLGVPAAAACWPGAPWVSQLVFQTPQYGHYFRITFVTAALIFQQEIGFAYLIRAKSGTVVILQCARVLLTVALNFILLVRYSMGVDSVFDQRAGLHSTDGGHSERHDLFAEAAIVRRSPVWLSVPLRSAGRHQRSRHAVHQFRRPLLPAKERASSGHWNLPLAYKLGMLVGYVQYPFNWYWDSQMFRIVREPGGERAYVRVCTYIVMALTGAALALSVFAGPLVEILAAPSFRRADVFVHAI